MKNPTPDTSHGVWYPQGLDVRAFAQAGAVIVQDTPLASMLRLVEETQPGEWGQVRWRAVGELRPAMGEGKPSHWLHLSAQATIGLTCQRCLTALSAPLEVDRWFRFVATEAQAVEQDDDSEEDVLAWEPRPDVLGLLEDELIMAIPLVPMHDECPVSVNMGSQDDPEVSTERPNPFAALAKLKQRG